MYLAVFMNYAGNIKDISNYNSLVLLFLCVVVNKPGYYMVVTPITGQSNVSKSLTTRWCPR